MNKNLVIGIIVICIFASNAVTYAVVNTVKDQQIFLIKTQYERDITNLNDEISSLSEQIQNLILAGDGGSILVNGVFFENGTLETDSPWYYAPDVEPDSNLGSTGQYLVVLLDDQHHILGQFGFSVSFYYIDYSNGITGRHTNAMPFRFAIPYIQGTKFIEIQDSESNVLASKIKSLHSPTITILSPNGGEIIVNGEDYLITWEAQDEDNDSLLYEVYYSKDNGSNWSLLEYDLTEEHYTWHVSDMNPGDSYKIQILATDGVNTAVDESNETFSITMGVTPPE